MNFTDKFLDDLSKLIISLKLAQRAELLNEVNSKNIIADLYVDPLPNDAILKQIIGDSTVFLIGRKGTGKSTIFARAQEHLRQEDKEVSVYIDVKTLYGKSISKEINIESNDENIKKLLLLQHFISEILKELVKEVEKNLENKNVFKKAVNKAKYEKCKQKLSDIKEQIMKPEFIDVSMMLNTNNTTKGLSRNEDGGMLNATVSVQDKSIKNGKIDAKVDFKNCNSDEDIKEFSTMLVRHFSITEYMDNISSELKRIGINKVHIFLDDFSEIEFEAQQVFVNTILAPLNNWSDKFFRFKIGCYPNRIFYGDIEKGKVNEINLDYYSLYKVKDLPELEEKAIDFLERLLKKRFNYYLNIHPSEIFVIVVIDSRENTWDSYIELLFKISMNIPRILGYILDYCYQSSIIYNKKITKTLLEEAAQKYYENQVFYYFEKTNYLAEAFEENLDRYAQHILIDNIVDRAKDLKTKLGNEDTELFKDIAKNKIPTSHFYIKKKYEKFFYSLELNYFLTKYYEQADRDGITISIYAINYGLCKSKNIVFGRPKGESKYRKYYISRHFDNSELLERYLLNQTKYVCKNCGMEYDFNELETLKITGYLCYKGCKESNYIEEEYCFDAKLLFRNINDDDLLSEIELDILHILNQNKQLNLYAKSIARELDCSYQLVSKKSINLESKGLIKKQYMNIDGDNRKVYKITEKAKRIYFSK